MDIGNGAGGSIDGKAYAMSARVARRGNITLEATTLAEMHVVMKWSSCLEDDLYHSKIHGQ